MDGTILALIPVGLIAVGNVILAAYKFGKLEQKVDDTTNRLNRIENKLNNCDIKTKD